MEPGDFLLEGDVDAVHWLPLGPQCVLLQSEAGARSAEIEVRQSMFSKYFLTQLSVCSLSLNPTGSASLSPYSADLTRKYNYFSTYCLTLIGVSWNSLTQVGQLFLSIKL